MKYLIILASGLADAPLPELGGRTPLAAASAPALDELARCGKTGCVRTLPEGLPASEEVALLSSLGYDPRNYFSGEGGLAAADTGLAVGPDRFAFCHSLCTEGNGLLLDHAASHITPREAEALLTSLAAAAGRPEFRFHVGRGFAGVTVLPAEESSPPRCLPPEEVLGRPVGECMPQGKDSEAIRKLMQLSREVFAEHEVNRVRADLGENPANLLWLWGPGRPPALPSFESLFHLRAAMIAAAESARGLARLCGMTVPHLSGATGSYSTDYAEKAARALDLIYEMDAVFIHVASPAEASLEGNVARKVAAIQDIAAMIVAPLLQFVQRRTDTRLLLISTHVASVATRRRTRDATPVAMCGPGIEPLRYVGFSEEAARSGELGIEQAHDLLPYFLIR